MSFSQALSGLNAQQQKLGATGNNIANSQTVGYKNSDVLFADVFAGARGVGVSVSDVRQDFTQGSIESTNRNLDLAIAGEGFYRLQQTSGEVGYSRNGQFSMTAEGNLVNAQGDRLMGYGLDENVTEDTDDQLAFPFSNVLVGSDPQALRVPVVDMPASKTSEVNGVFNIDSSIDPDNLTVQKTQTFSVTDSTDAEMELDLNYHFSNSYTIYDSLGNARQMTTYFEKLGDNTWLATSAADGKILGSSGAANQFTPQSFLLNFNSNGNLLTKADVEASGVTATAGTAFDNLPDQAILGVTPVLGSFNFTRTAPDPLERAGAALTDEGGVLETPADITALITDGSAVLSGSSFGLSINGVQGSESFAFDYDFEGTTQFANDSIQKNLTQDGFASGTLVGINVLDDGTVMRNFSNEQSAAAGQIALASFRNEEGLQPLGNNLWGATVASGNENLGTPGAGLFGQIESGAVEASNVDLPQELVDMIVAQRAYQANSTTISTQDELLQTIINL